MCLVRFNLMWVLKVSLCEDLIELYSQDNYSPTYSPESSMSGLNQLSQRPRWHALCHKSSQIPEPKATVLSIKFHIFLFYITKKGFDLMFIFSRIRKKSWILSGWLHKELLICFEKMDGHSDFQLCFEFYRQKTNTQQVSLRICSMYSVQGHDWSSWALFSMILGF